MPYARLDFAAKFGEALTYERFLEVHGSAGDRRNWQTVGEQIALSDEQRRLLASFRREMKVLVLAGAWCGDCVDQCPIFQQFAAASAQVLLRFVDRDADEELRQELSVCGGARVPVVVFLSEDGQEVGRYGDRTLARYRQLASGLEGVWVSSGSRAGRDAVVQDWLNEFERVQLLLRTSPRLRTQHGD